MKKKHLFIGAFVCIAAIGIGIFVISGRGGHRPFRDLDASDVISANVQLIPPETTVQITEINELVSYLHEVVTYKENDSYTEYTGQAAVFSLDLSDGSKLEITEYDPFIIINGVGYRCKYEPCTALNDYANRLLSHER